MGRHVAAVAVALCLNPLWVSAQSTTLTVSTSSADVYKSPSTGSPVIGSVPRGAELIVTRELGSWVKVSWPQAQDGIGYVHVSKGTIGHASAAANRAIVSASTPAQPVVPGGSTTSTPPVVRTSVGEQSVSRVPVYVTPSTHVLGFGGLIVAPNAGFGASARAWRRDRLGIQVDVSHYAATSALEPGRMTSLRFEPSVLYSLPDRVTDYWWVRPYLGSGASVQRQTLALGPGTSDPASDSSLGVHAFGGGEVTFASMSRFALSGDVGYRWVRVPFAGFETGGLSISLSGHWYVK